MSASTGSYAHGASDVSLIGETIGASFNRTVATWGDQPGLIVRQQGIRWSYRELGEKVEAFAVGLVALGLRPGERIGIWSPNNAEWVVTQFATAKAGLTSSTVCWAKWCSPKPGWCRPSAAREPVARHS